MLDPNVVCGAVQSGPASSCILPYLSWHHSPSHLLHPYQLPGSLETLPGILFCLFALFLPTHPLLCNSSMPAQRRKPLLRCAWLPGLDQVGLFSRGSVGFLPSPRSPLIITHLLCDTSFHRLCDCLIWLQEAGRHQHRACTQEGPCEMPAAGTSGPLGWA